MDLSSSLFETEERVTLLTTVGLSVIRSQSLVVSDGKSIQDREKPLKNPQETRGTNSRRFDDRHIPGATFWSRDEFVQSSSFDFLSSSFR